MTAKGLSDNLKQRQPVSRRRRRALGRVRVLVRVVLGLARPPPRRDEEASLDASRPRCGPRVGSQSNLASTYADLGRNQDALRMSRDVYSGSLKLFGKQHYETLREANNLANSLGRLQHFEEAKSLLRKTIPVARRVLGENTDLTLRMRMLYAHALCRDANATLDDLRESVETLEELVTTARRVLGSAHPLTSAFEQDLRKSQEALAARQTPPAEDLAEEVD